MNIAVLSDIHANAQRLAAVLKRVEGADTIVNCGDVVGMGEVNRCMDLLAAAGVLSVSGGHDLEALHQEEDDSGLTLLDAFGNEVPADFGLTMENREQLRSWPLFRRIKQGNHTVVFTHGFIRNPAHPEIMEVVDRDNIDQFLRRISLVAGGPPRVVFVGHSHVPKWFAVGPDGRIEDEGCPTCLTTVRLRRGCTHVVDVGTVALPSWVWLDTGLGFFTIHR